jgi:hypothetical protein
MTRPRGNKTSKAEREKRKQQIAASLEQKKGMEQTRQELGISNGAFYRLLSEMNIDYANATMEVLGPIKAKLMIELAHRAEEVLEGKLDPKAATAWVKIINLISEVGGMKITRSMNVHVSANKDTLWLRFKKAIAGLSEPQVEEIIRYAERTPREKKKTVVKDASWFPSPEPKLIEGKTDDVA